MLLSHWFLITEFLMVHILDSKSVSEQYISWQLLSFRIGLSLGHCVIDALIP